MNRRNFLLGLAVGLAPAIIRTPGLLMPIRALVTGDAALALMPPPQAIVTMLRDNWWVFNGYKWLDSSNPEAMQYDVAERHYRWRGLDPIVSVSSEPCEEDL